MSRIVIVSNRLPLNITRIDGRLQANPSTGGLATGLNSLAGEYERLWIGWPGIADEDLDADSRGRVESLLVENECRGVYLSGADIEDYYHGYCNRTIWPLFHYFTQYTIYEERQWQTYKRVNEAFCDVVLRNVRPGDTIWVQDYQLLLLPQMIREKMPDARIGFFLHIPFPSYELFRLLPWRTELLYGMLGADLLGFHTYDYVRHFLSSVSRLTGIEHNLGRLLIGERVVRVDAFPMGIDYEKYSRAAENPEVQKHIEMFANGAAGRKVVVSIDRLDYTKGIIQRLEAFDLFISQNPQYRGKVMMVLLAVPSRSGVDDYVMLREQLERLVSRINGEYGSMEWMPVWYLYRSLTFERLMALYNVADIALVTPLRDGMNLIAKEFIAAKTDGKGVLILSEMAGAASELGEALMVNANNKQGVTEAIKHAMEMPEGEQIARNRVMQRRLSRYSISRWASDFMDSLNNACRGGKEYAVNVLSDDDRSEMIDRYVRSSSRLLLLDYDGTLTRFDSDPEKAAPDEELKDLIRKLAGDEKNEVVIISGRDKDILDTWMEGLDVAMIAEHGAWNRRREGQWHMLEGLRTEWKDVIRPVLELYVDRTPGAWLEEKAFSLVWHCRKADPELVQVRMSELKAAVANLTENTNIGVYEGSRILEVKHTTVNKALGAEAWLAAGHWEFVFAVGDDDTDEDMFGVLPRDACSFKVGRGMSAAKYNLTGVAQVRRLLAELAASAD